MQEAGGNQIWGIPPVVRLPLSGRNSRKIPEKKTGNALRAFPGIPLKSTAGTPQASLPTSSQSYSPRFGFSFFLKSTSFITPSRIKFLSGQVPTCSKSTCFPFISIRLKVMGTCLYLQTRPLTTNAQNGSEQTLRVRASKLLCESGRIPGERVRQLSTVAVLMITSPKKEACSPTLIPIAPDKQRVRSLQLAYLTKGGRRTEREDSC